MHLKTITFIALIAFLTSFNALSDEIYQENAAKLCQKLTQKSYKTKCMAIIKKMTFNDSALEYCAKQKSWSKIQKCLPVIKNTDYEAAPLAICTSAKYFNKEFKNCLKEITNKSYVSSIEVDMCAQERTLSKKVKCLKTATSKPYAAPIVETTQTSAAIELKTLQGNVVKAYELMRNNKTADATILLHDLVKDFEEQ